MIMLKHLYKTALIAFFGILSFPKSFAQCPSNASIVSDDTVCVNAGSVSIAISDATIGVKYVAFLGSTRIDSIIATSPSALIMTPIAKLPIGNSKISIQAKSTSCPIVNLKDSAIVLVNQLPRTDQRIVSKPYCPGAAASIIIYGTRPGEIYEPNLNAMAIGAPVKSVTDTVLLNIATNMLPSGVNEIYFRASIEGCAMVQLENKGHIMPMPIGDYFYRVVGDTICSSNPDAELLFTNTSPVVNHQIYINEIAVLEPFKGENNNFIKKIPTSLLTVGANKIEVQAVVETGCATQLINTTASVLVHPSPKIETPILIGDTVSLPASVATIKVTNSEVGVLYQAFKDNIAIGASVIGLGNEIELKLPIGSPNGLGVGIHLITVPIEIQGCGIVTAIGSTTIVVKPALTTSIEDKQATSNFAVYPNPFSSEITITSKLKGQLKMQITDAVGNIVHQESISNLQDLKLNPDLKTGLYFLQMESEGVRETVKLIKQ